jgi:pimeloyl-ACP methyl ester carboxylesterase
MSRGEGSKPVLLVHGFLGSGRNLVSLARKLCEVRPDWRVLLPDLRGHGASPPLREGDGLEQLAADLCELAGAHGSSCRLMGHSLGGRVALSALSLRPELFTEVDLLDIAPGPLRGLSGPMQRLFERLMGAPAVMESRTAMRDFFLAGDIDVALTDWALTNLDVGADGSVHWRIDRAALASLHWRETGDDRWSVVSEHASKLRCIAGGKSSFVPPPVRERFVRAGVRVDVLPAAGHFLHVDALPELVATLTAKP